MESRMEKYYRDDLSTYERSKKNEQLYKDVSREISDLENLPVPDNSNEIDLDGLKQIISSRDEYRKTKELEKTIMQNKPLVEEPKQRERKIYDINVLLENAKNELNKKSEVESKKIINTNFLTTMEEPDIPKVTEAVEVSFQMKEENKEIINTDSLPLDILMDLKGNENTVVTDPIVKEEVTMIKQIKDGETFYSGSFNFTKKDFDEYSDEDDNFLEEKNHTGLKIFFLILGIIILIAALYLIVAEYIL